MGQVTNTEMIFDYIPWQSTRFSQVQEAWDYLAVVDTRAAIFSRREWFALGVETGAIKPWGVLLIRTDRPIALFPLQRRFPGCWELVSLLGQGEMQLLIDPAQEEQAWQGLAQWIQQTSQIGLLSLGITEHRHRLDLLSAACGQHGLVMKEKPLAAPAIWSELPESWEAFRRQIGSSAWRNIRRAEKKLRELCSDCSIDCYTSPDDCAAAIPELVRLYRHRWEGEMLVCQFDDPANVRFYQQAIRWAAEQGWAMVFTVRLRGKPVLVQTQFFLPGQGALYQHFTARDINALPNQLSPGMVGSAYQFRWAIEHGLARVNQGAVNMPYKQLFGGEEHPRWTVSIARSNEAYLLLGGLSRGWHILRHLPAYALLSSRQLVTGKRHKRQG